jgi:signal transduction histidine kinase
MIATSDPIPRDFLAGGGEMGARIRAFDWAAKPLGAIRSWPQSLKTAVSLILSSQHPMWIGWGPEMVFLYNDAYFRVLGPAKHPGALGNPAAKVWAEIWDVCGPLADKVFDRGEATFLDDVRLFMDRGSFLEETFYSFSYSPIRDDVGGVSGLFCPSTDVTLKVVNARRLGTLSELAASSLIEKTTASACATAWRIMSKNPDDIPFALLYLADTDYKSALLEQVAGNFANHPENSIDLTRNSQRSPWPVAEVLRTGQRQSVPTAHVPGLPRGVANQPIAEAVVLPVSSRGEHRPYGAIVAGVNPCRPLDAEHLTFFELVAGQVAAAIQNVRAVEEEKKRADMLAEIDRAKTVFFSNVSHEFRTPLTLMLGPLENLLAKTEGTQPEEHEQLVMAHRNSMRLLKLVNSLLDFSRLEAGRLKASYAPTDLSTLTANIASTFRSAMQAARLDFVVDCGPLPEPVCVDRGMWENIVLNLLSNAFKFTFEGQVTVRVGSDDDQAVLTVSDTGIGIEEEELPRIFERFHRVEGARGRTYEGTGIGLALIQEYVKLHGGSISVSSRVGKGSTFTVRLPFGTAHLPADRLNEAGESQFSTTERAQVFTDEVLTWLPRGKNGALAATAAKADKTQESAGTRPRILVADDNADMREHVNRILGGDYDVVTANDGRQALELVRKNPPDLLLSDVMMPGLDGLELLWAVRRDPQTQTLPVIFFSARAGEEMRVEGLDAGADDYLPKPFTANELRARVGAHLQMGIARRRATEREAALRAQAEAARDQAEGLNEELRRANQDLEQFAYSASHDLQEPLRSIKIYGELLTKRYSNRLDGQAFQFLDYLRTGASRMEMLVRDLLAYTQVSKLERPTEATDANAAFSNTLASLSGAITESDASVTSDPLPCLRVHKAHLEQLFQNLIGNAIKYLDPERTPVVHVSVKQENGRWVFSVRDNGLGIEPEYKEHIFGLFKRLHTGDEYSGTGLGLAICQRIVERYQGRIWVDSEPGQGSTFLFTLPV